MHTPSPNLLAGFRVTVSAFTGARGVRRRGALASSVLASFVATQPVSLPRGRRGVKGGGLLSRIVRGAGSAGALSCRSLLGSRVRSLSVLLAARALTRQSSGPARKAAQAAHFYVDMACYCQ